MKYAYYNEFDPQAAAWLRELIKAGLIAPGIVDERSIEDVTPNDLRGFAQCHFFAGIGGWSYALRLAGWSDDRPVWTGSPPCQPFSNAGKQKAQADARHLWPVFFNLIRECQPANIFGEQVEAAIRTGWLDDLQDDLEAENYATGKIVLPACSAGAPHIRQRIWFVAERLADTTNDGHAAPDGLRETTEPPQQTWAQNIGQSSGGSDNRGVAESNNDRCSQGKWNNQATGHGNTIASESDANRHEPADAPDGFWRAADWLFCRDGKWRPVESSLLGIFNGLPDELVRGCNISPACNPLAKDQEARVMRLKGYGNAIVPPLAAEFIKAYLSIDFGNA